LIARPRTLSRARRALAAYRTRTGRAWLAAHYSRRRHASLQRRIPIGPASYHQRLKEAAIGGHVCYPLIVLAKPAK
jgi:hypothetical protein